MGTEDELPEGVSVGDVKHLLQPEQKTMTADRMKVSDVEGDPNVSVSRQDMT